MADPTTVKNLPSPRPQILVVCANEHLRNCIKVSMHDTLSSLNRFDIITFRDIHRSADVASVLIPSSPIKEFDFYVFIIEPKLPNCLKRVEEELKVLGPSWSRNKICLVAVGAHYGCSVKPDDLWKFAQIYQVNLLLGDFMTEKKAEYLCTRILHLCEIANGVPSGIPLTEEKAKHLSERIFHLSNNASAIPSGITMAGKI